MIHNYINNLSICHGFQTTYFMSQQFSIALIIEFVETLNREVKENTSFLSNASKFGMLLSTNILLAQLRGGTCRILRLLYATRILEKEDLLYFYSKCPLEYALQMNLAASIAAFTSDWKQLFQVVLYIIHVITH